MRVSVIATVLLFSTFPTFANDAVERCDRLASSQSEPGHMTVYAKAPITIEAVRACEEAVKQAPDDAATLWRLARAYTKTDQEETGAPYRRKAADLGYAVAQYELAQRYKDAGDLVAASSWHKKAADQEFGLAEHFYAEALFFGDGVAKDLKLARAYYLKAIRHLDLYPLYRAHALTNLAYAEAEDWNFSDAREHFREAAIAYLPFVEQGEPEALYHYGAFQFNGYGVPQDIQAGLANMRRAAEQGVVAAQKDLEKALELQRQNSVPARQASEGDAGHKTFCDSIFREHGHISTEAGLGGCTMNDW